MRLIYPMLAQIAWTFVVAVLLVRARARALGAGEVKLRDVAISTEAYPDYARQAGANFSNQFETPVLFYALALVATHVGATGWVMAALAWTYVASRVVHTLIHTGANQVMTRFRVFLGGVAALAAMWVGIVAALL
jgi:hypothetical protein